MDAKSFLYAAEMTDQLTTVIREADLHRPLVPELGTPYQLFCHLIRVRGVYRNGLISGKVEFPGERITTQNPIEDLRKSREVLAEAIKNTSIAEVYWGEDMLSPFELIGAAIQHEGIHQGQWQLALKQAGVEIPGQWGKEWAL
ncbi:DinB family protein [Shouchella shacheensis]|uniref:DinB family protein n=1 Tax=Shouchella shacheensis TaxID=1649580 RepID=UPI0007405044|nr:DinB family protein [Shouchella shacheensis]